MSVDGDQLDVTVVASDPDGVELEVDGVRRRYRWGGTATAGSWTPTTGT